MDAQIVPQNVFEEFLAARNRSNQAPLTTNEFYIALRKWYDSFQNSECTLGFAAQQLGITKIDLIALLDMLDWKTTNL